MRRTCTKIYADIPFAHRAHKHKGHCADIHGHSWTFEFTFAAGSTDEAGFIMDFGKLQPLKAWIENRFDHKLVLSGDDPKAKHLVASLQDEHLADIKIIPDCSAEGIAAYLLECAGEVIHEITAGRVSLVRVTVREDSRNSATIER